MEAAEATRRRWKLARRTVGYLVGFAFYGCLLIGMIYFVAIIISIVNFPGVD